MTFLFIYIHFRSLCAKDVSGGNPYARQDFLGCWYTRVVRASCSGYSVWRIQCPRAPFLKKERVDGTSVSVATLVHEVFPSHSMARLWVDEGGLARGMFGVGRRDCASRLVMVWYLAPVLLESRV